MEEKTEFDDIFRTYYSQLFIFALQMVNDKEECHDIVNSAYEYVWNNFRTIERPTVKSYLYALVKSKCIDYLRHVEAHNQYVAVCMEHDKADNLDADDTDERIIRIRELVQTLNPHTREVIEACYIDQKKYSEVAEEMGITPSAVKKQIMKALKIIRAEFAKK